MKRFDERTAWLALPPAAQESLGVAAIALAVAAYGAEVAEDEIQERSFLAAAHGAQEDIATLTDGVFSRDEVPGIPASLGQVCRVCGCSDYDACEGRRDRGAVRMGRGRPLLKAARGDARNVPPTRIGTSRPRMSATNLSGPSRFRALLGSGLARDRTEFRFRQARPQLRRSRRSRIVEAGERFADALASYEAPRRQVRLLRFFDKAVLHDTGRPPQGISNAPGRLLTCRPTFIPTRLASHGASTSAMSTAMSLWRSVAKSSSYGVFDDQGKRARPCRKSSCSASRSANLH